MATMDSALERRITIVGREGAGVADGATTGGEAATVGVGAAAAVTVSAAAAGVAVSGVLLVSGSCGIGATATGTNVSSFAWLGTLRSTVTGVEMTASRSATEAAADESAPREGPGGCCKSQKAFSEGMRSGRGGGAETRGSAEPTDAVMIVDGEALGATGRAVCLIVRTAAAPVPRADCEPEGAAARARDGPGRDGGTVGVMAVGGTGACDAWRAVDGTRLRALRPVSGCVGTECSGSEARFPLVRAVAAPECDCAPPVRSIRDSSSRIPVTDSCCSPKSLVRIRRARERYGRALATSSRRT